MALTSEREIKICLEYGSYDHTGRVRCRECPLSKMIEQGPYDCLCKAFMHYDRHLGEWVPDEVQEDE